MAIDRLGNPGKPSETVFVSDRIDNLTWVGTVISNAEIARTEVLGIRDTPRRNKGINQIFTNLNNVTGLVGRGFGNAKDLETAIAADPKNPNLLTEQQLLAQTVYLGMRDGGDPAMQAALKSGVVAQIETVLPDRLKEVAREVRNLEVTNPDIRTALDMMDSTAENNMWGVAEPTAEERGLVLRAALGNLTGAMAKIPSGHADRPQLEMVVKSLRKQISLLGQPGNNADLKRLVELAEEQRAEEERKRKASELPTRKDEQLIYVRNILDKIESSEKTTRDLYKGQFAAALEEMIERPEMLPEVAVEIRSRLKLHDCAVLMKKANGYVESPKSGGDPECPNVGMAATLAEGMGRALDREAIKFFLKTDANGINVAKAWDLYQDINLNYKEILRSLERTPGELVDDTLKVAVDGDRDMGTIDANYFTDANGERKARVDNYAIDLIMQQSRSTRVLAEKAWVMAKRLHLATGENSIFNAAMTGNDQMAESIFLKIYRQKRDDSGRPRGPQVTIKNIVGLGNSWLRQVSDKPAYDNQGVVPLRAADVKVDEIGEGSMVFHFGVIWSGKIQPLRELLLDRKPDPKTLLSKDFMQTAVDFFNKADKDGSKNLRYWWVVGVLDMAASNGDLGWTQGDISKFRQFLTQEKLSESAGTFLTQEQWADIMKNPFVWKQLKLEWKRILFDFTSAMSGGGARRK